MPAPAKPKESKEKSEENLRIETSVKNKGNVHIRPAGKVTIEDKAGKKLIELDLEFGKAALPGQEIAYNASWNNSKLEKSNEYKVSATINYGKELNMEKIAAIEKMLEVTKDGKVIVK